MVNLYQADADYLRYQNGTYVNYSQGIIGVAIFNAGSQYFAYDLTCPDHAFDPVTSRLVQKNLMIRMYTVPININITERNLPSI